MDERPVVRRRALLGAVVAALGAGCVGDGRGPESDPTGTTAPTDEGQTAGTPTDGRPEPTGAIPGDRLVFTNRSDEPVRLAVTMRGGGTVLYGETVAFAPGEKLALGEQYTGTELTVRVAPPDGEVVFEETVPDYVRLSVAIRSRRELEVTSATMR